MNILECVSTSLAMGVIAMSLSTGSLADDRVLNDELEKDLVEKIAENTSHLEDVNIRLSFNK